MDRFPIDFMFELSKVEKTKKFFKHIDNGIFEIRVEQNSNTYRIFCIFDKDNLVIMLHGIHKKYQKLSRKEIEKAIRLKKKYFNEKKESRHRK